MVWYGVVWYGVVWCSGVWCGVLGCSMAWCGVVWCAVPCCAVVPGTLPAGLAHQAPQCLMVCRRTTFMSGCCCWLLLTPYHTISHHTIPYHTTPYHTIPHHTTITHQTNPDHTKPDQTVVNVVKNVVKSGAARAGVGGGVVWCVMVVWCGGGMAWYGVVWCSVVWSVGGRRL